MWYVVRSHNELNVAKVASCVGKFFKTFLSNFSNIHRESKKGATLTMAITLSILDRFAKFFHCMAKSGAQTMTFKSVTNKHTKTQRFWPLRRLNSSAFAVHYTKFRQLILRKKIIQTVATRCHILKLKCTKFDFGWGSAPDPECRRKIAEIYKRLSRVHERYRRQTE